MDITSDPRFRTACWRPRPLTGYLGQVTDGKLEDALELAELAEQMVRERFRRAHPEDSEEELEKRVLGWLHTRPGAEFGDAVGRVVALPRVR